MTTNNSINHAAQSTLDRVKTNWPKLSKDQIELVRHNVHSLKDQLRGPAYGYSENKAHDEFDQFMAREPTTEDNLEKDHPNIQEMAVTTKS